MKQKIIKQILQLKSEHQLTWDEIIEASMVYKKDEQPQECQVLKRKEAEQSKDCPDIEKYLSARCAYDLLVNFQGRYLRVHFDKETAKDLPCIGIFPFAESSYYLRLEESCECNRFNLREDGIPSLSFWERVYRIKDELNEKLAIIGVPILEGPYFANPRKNNSKLSHIVAFNGNPTLDHDEYGLYETAKVRYIGSFYQ